MCAYEYFPSEDKLEEYLSKKIKETKEQIDKKTHIRDPKDIQDFLVEICTLKEEDIQEFEDLYIRLKEKNKFDIKKLVNISIDYCDWYFYQKEYYDPMNDELWNTNSYDHQKEAWMKIDEIQKRLKRRLK